MPGQKQSGNRATVGNNLALGALLTAYGQYCSQVRNFHPDIKPLRFGRWLERLIALGILAQTVNCVKVRGGEEG
jgi:hypothetical protein